MPDAGKETGYLVSGGFHLVSGGDKGGGRSVIGRKFEEREGVGEDGDEAGWVGMGKGYLRNGNYRIVAVPVSGYYEK